ncbi:unnamed protein product [Musa textilis]
MGNNKKRKEKNHKKKKRKATGEQTLALRYVHEWVFRDSPPAFPAGDASDDFAPQSSHKIVDPIVFELHCHSNHSDGFLSPSAVVERAQRNGCNFFTPKDAFLYVKVLALTDHDTMAGIPEATETAQKYGMRIIPGVEISAIYSPRYISSTNVVIWVSEMEMVFITDEGFLKKCLLLLKLMTSVMCSDLLFLYLNGLKARTWSW